MGAFYNSICVPGHHHTGVRTALIRWLTHKGFELRAGPVLFDLDGDYERSIFLVWNESWTVLFYSHYEEERRLIRELQGEHSPLLYCWVQDSDAWGYDLFDSDGFAASYASDPRSYQSFSGEPEGTPRPRGDAEILCRILGLPDKAAELRQAERLRLPFKEDVCRRFCRVLGVEVAASSYDDLESGLLRDLEDWQSEQLVFVLRDLRSGSEEVALHRYELKRLQPELGYAPSETVELSPEILAEMKKMRRRVRKKFRLLRPISYVAKAWRRLLESARSPPVSPSLPETPPAVPRGHFHLESAVLKNDRHRCRITLAEGVRPNVVSTRPAAVFAFAVGEMTVTCTARRRSKIEEVLRKPSRSRVLLDEKYKIEGLSARHFVFELPPSFVAGSQHPSYLAIYIIQTERALYVFLHRSATQLPESLRRAVRATVDSFRLLEE